MGKLSTGAWLRYAGAAIQGDHPVSRNLLLFV